MMDLGDDPVLQSQIPRVKELCHALGFGASRLKFQKSLICWRKNYRTDSGSSGMDVGNWGRDSDRHDLGVMAQRYLETGGHARKHWPSNEQASARGRLVYPRDELEIANLLRRLFWRQNDCAAKNAMTRGRSTLSDDDSIVELSRVSAEHSPVFSRRRPQLSQSAVLNKRTQDWSAVKDESREMPSHGLPDLSTYPMGSLPSEKSNEHPGTPVRGIQDTPWGENSRQPVDLENENDGDGREHGTLTMIVTLKYRQSQRNRVHQSSGGRAIIAPIIVPPADVIGNDTRPPSRSHPGNIIPAQTKSPFGASSSQNDDDPDMDDNDEEYVPTRASSRKRGRSDGSGAFRSLRRPTKRMHTSMRPELDYNRSPTVTCEETSDDTVLPPLTSKSRRSTMVAMKHPPRFRGAFPSPPEILPLGSPNSSASDSEDSVQRQNDHVGSSLSENTSEPAHGGRAPSPTVTELGGSSHPMQPLPSRSKSGHSIQARNVQPNTRVEIFVIASCGSGDIIEKWRGGKLREQRLSTIFDEVSTLTSRSDIEKIKFKLKTLRKTDGINSVVERGDMAAFEFIMERFHERIRERKNAGETKFSILLEPHLEQQGGAVGAEVSRDSESDGHDW